MAQPLAASSAASASLLLNQEGVIFGLLAWFVFQEGIDPRGVRSAYRSRFGPAYRSNFLGFRLAQDL